ncbi:MAG: AMP-binding protein [Planctomycetota bacterium]|jgi:fatty-acyl-CoA synthase
MSASDESPDRVQRRSYLHRGGDQPLLGVTIDEQFRQVVRAHAERDALVSRPESIRLSYRGLDEAVEAVSRGLLALGVARGDRVGIWSTDNVPWVLVQLATARIGAILVNINPAYRVAELEHALRKARVQVLILIPSFRSSDYIHMVSSLCPQASAGAPDGFVSPRLPDLRRVVVVDPDDLQGTTRPRTGFLIWPELIERGRAVSATAVQARRATLDPDDPINIQFTSGTTGFPKAVVLTHHNVLNNAWFTAEVLRITPEDRLCVPVPFYHCFGMVVSNLVCLSRGAAIIIPAPHFEPGATLEAIETERCTVVHGVPTMFIAEMERPEFAARDLSSLRTGIMGGAPCPPDLVRRVMEKMGCRDILVGYGQTEASPITNLTRPDDPFERRTTTVGTSLPHQELKIVDPDDGLIVPLGEPGEVCFRGYHVMRGYFEQPDATAQAIDEFGWLHSGDIGVLNADGYLRITGRLKDMIIRGGENIYPAEIEAFLFQHPKVAQVAVFGMPDSRLGEAVGAWIKLEEGEAADADEIREYAAGRIAHYKIPARIWIVDAFPMTVTGKIQKYRIREIVCDWLEQEAAGDSVARHAGATE